MPEVELISFTKDPVNTLARVWAESRCLDVKKLDKQELFRQMVHGKFPVTEMVQFVFLLKDVTVAFREQLVRHRIGMKHGDSYLLESFPDVHDSTWWSQTSRARDLKDFCRKGYFDIPESIAKTMDHHNRPLVAQFNAVLEQAEKFYNRAVELGVPPQDARMVMPHALTHTLAWSVNLSALIHVMKHRCCFIAQLGLWKPIIRGIISELTTKVDPIFFEISKPPCWKDESLHGSLCPFKLDNERRITNDDPEPPCPVELFDRCRDWEVCKTDHPDMLERIPEYEELWGVKIDV